MLLLDKTVFMSPLYDVVYGVTSQTGDESHPSAAVEDILLTPDKLRDLDLDAFAEELERQVHTYIHAYIGRQERF